MLATELQARLEQLLERKIADPAARARAAAGITARIVRLHPIAHAATQIAKGAGAARLHGLGAGEAQGAGGAVAGAKAGAAVGSVVPVVGTVIGAVVGAVAGFLISHKNYINVNTDNAEEDQDVLDIWPQYRRIAGQAAGRDIGLPLLERIWRGAVYSQQDFTANHAKVCFHAGCLKYPGNPDWISGHMYWAGSPVTFPATMAKAPAGMDPATFVDQVFIPAQSQDKPPWAIPVTSAGRQILIDIADAMLAQKGAPYFYGTPQQSSALPQALAPPAPTVAPGPVSFPGAAPAQPLIATTPNTSSDQLLAALLAQQGISATSPQGQQLIRDVSAGGVQQAGLFGAGTPQWLLIGGAVLAMGLMLAHPAGARPESRRAA